jgi:cysteine desulfuration protein SufE
VDAKYAYLLELSERLPPMDGGDQHAGNLVDGCQSKLWFLLKEEDGKFTLQADSDSFVIKGIAALLVRLVEGRSAAEIERISLDFIDRLNIWKLPSERNNGLVAMLNHIKEQVNSPKTIQTEDQWTG